MKLWQTKNSVRLHPLIEDFTVGNDLWCDEFLIGYDCVASVGHAYMLSREGHITKTEFKKVKTVLHEIFNKAINNSYRLKAGDEDGHTAIENLLTQKVGELGGKIHLGRSRNDQSATAIRLFAKNELLQIRHEILATSSELFRLAKKYEKLPMPAYTHTRPAMVGSIGHYFAAFAETLLDDYACAEKISEMADTCPLGAAAGVGTGVPLDRTLTAKVLGFARPQNNTLATQLSRGKLEAMILSVLSNMFITLSRLANDLIYFSAPEFDFLELSPEVATGSSIMPQKKNPDALEVLRASAGTLLGYYVQVATITKGIPAGYQRDLQLTKEPLISGVKLAKRSLSALRVVLTSLKVNRKKLIKAASDPTIYAACLANRLVTKQKLSFREAYQKVKEAYAHAALKSVINFPDAPDFDPVHHLAEHGGLGMPGNLNLKLPLGILARAERGTNLAQKQFEVAMKKVWSL